MKAASTPYRTQIIERALHLRYQDLIDDVVEIRDDVQEAVSKYDPQALMELMSRICVKTQEMDEIHRMLGERCQWVAEPQK